MGVRRLTVVFSPARGLIEDCKMEENGSLKKGVSYDEKFDASKSPRQETNKDTQRPKGSEESMSSDRGTFKSRC
jgi:hypothetical protein